MKRFDVLAYAVCMALATQVASAELVVNGTFTDTQGNNEAGPPWVMNEDPNGEYAGGIDTGRFQKNGFANREGNVPGSNGGVWFRSFNGNNGDNPNIFVDLTVTQTIAGLVNGQEYIFSASVKQEDNHRSDSIAAVLGSDLNFDLKAGVPADSSWQDLSTTFVYTGGSSDLVLDFVDGSDAGVNPQSFFVDNVSIVPVPEATSIALVTVGIVSLLGSRRRV